MPAEGLLPRVPDRASLQPDFEVGIIGAGFSGLVAAVELRRAGCNDFIILERADDVGGVWRENVYPGCACDVPAQLYSIARRPNPDWSRNFAHQSEILDYLRGISREDGIGERVRLGFDVLEARFDAARGHWRLIARDGRVVHVRVLIAAMGPHSRPKLPPLPGRDKFSGTLLHSSQWDHSLPLQGRKVAVIGTGASAIQIVPALAGVVAELIVVQRSAPWVLPRGERQRRAWERWLFRKLPFTQRLSRAAVYWLMEFIGLAFVGPRPFNKLLGAVVMHKLAREVHDPLRRAQLVPDYRVGCKRLMVSDDYYPAFNRSDVKLVTSPFVALTAGGFETADGVRHEADHIVFATGFHVADPDDFLRIVGLDGRVLADEWARDGANAFQGTTVSGYPNLALLLGPNSGLSHSSAIHVVESQMAYVVGYLQALRAAGGGVSLDVEADVQQAYNRELQARLSRMVWNSGCHSWYIDRAGRNTAIFPGLTWRFRRMMRDFDPSPYRQRACTAAD
jgi:cation diffusion facilitator CzcD-associated flavoprotein CzcO